MTQEWTPDSVARTLINPGYCLSQPPVVDEEQWIKANARLIRELGAETYLATLLSVLRANAAGN
jgi:hypothetical protein